MAQADVLTPAGEVGTRQGTFPNTGSADGGMDVAWLLRTIRSAAPHNVEDGQRIKIARMQQLLAERD